MFMTDSLSDRTRERERAIGRELVRHNINLFHVTSLLWFLQLSIIFIVNWIVYILFNVLLRSLALDHSPFRSVFLPSLVVVFFVLCVCDTWYRKQIKCHPFTCRCTYTETLHTISTTLWRGKINNTHTNHLQFRNYWSLICCCSCCSCCYCW